MKAATPTLPSGNLGLGLGLGGVYGFGGYPGYCGYRYYNWGLYYGA